MLRVFTQHPFFYKVCFIFPWLNYSPLEQLSPGMAYVTTTWIRLAVDSCWWKEGYQWENRVRRWLPCDHLSYLTMKSISLSSPSAFVTAQVEKYFFIHSAITWTSFSKPNVFGLTKHVMIFWGVIFEVFKYIPQNTGKRKSLCTLEGFSKHLIITGTVENLQWYFG